MACFCWSLIAKKLAVAKSEKAVISDDSSMTVAKASDVELSTLHKRMKEVQAVLRKTRQLGGRANKLPWYLLIGAPGVGKTTTLMESDLKFPLSEVDGASAEIDGVRQCNWWLTDEAVMLDTPGRYATHERDGNEDKLAWRGFLQLIRKYRRRRPIHGLIVVLSVADLQQKSDSALHVQALAIRERIKELHEQFGIRFPIYVLLTKCDMLAGFGEFFDNLGREARAQVWGLTFPLAKADQIDHALSLFPGEWRQLEQQLQCRVLDRLQQEHDVQRRALIYNFPQQFAGIGDALYSFLSRAFESSRYEVRALLRGVYFCSATQDNPADRTMASPPVDAAPGRDARPVNVAGRRSYFIARLLREVILQEAGLAGANLQFERRRRWLKWGAMTLIVSLLAVGAAGLINSYLRNQSYVAEQARRSAEIALSANMMSTQDGLASSLPLLNAVRDLQGAYAKRNKAGPFSLELGLYQGDKLNAGSQQLYGRLLREIFLPRIVSRMEAELRRGSANNADYLFEALRVYLMLGDRLHFDAEALRAWIDYDSERHLPGLDVTQRRALSDHVAELLRDPDEINGKLKLDADLIERARLILRKTPLPQRLYGRMKQEMARFKLPAFDVAAVGGRDTYQVLMRNSGESLSQGVAGMYTLDGYRQFIAQVDQSIADMVKDDWVLHQSEVVVGKDQEQQIKTDLEQLYFDDYIKQWDGLLDDVAIVPFSSLNQAARVTAILSAADSPLRRFLQEAARQTTLDDLSLSASVPDAASSGIEEKFNIAKKKLKSILSNGNGETVQLSSNMRNPVDAHFEELHKMVGMPGVAIPLVQVLSELKDAAAFFDAASTARAAGMPVPANAALASLKRAAIDKPAPLAGILQSIDSSAAGLTLGSERARLNALWSGGIAAFCRKAIANRYPVLGSATEEVTPDDFANFFGPAGMMDDFFGKNLRPYVDMSGAQWHWRPVNNVSLGLSQRALNTFQRAATIREQFFNAGKKQASLRFTLTPRSVDPYFAKILLEVDDQTLTYERNTASRPSSFQLPSAMGANLIRLEATPAAERSEIKTAGAWAWFHLMDQGKLESSAQGERFKLSFDLGGRPLVFDLTASSVNNPFNRDALEKFECLNYL